MFRNKGPMKSNLECLLERTTPVIPSKILPKSEIRKLKTLWHPLDREEVEYFTLSDLWNSYDEWSVYGAGVPVTLNDRESLVQYYVPYLSAIQIFTSNSVGTGAREETGTHSERTDSFSDSLSYESESEKLSRSDGCSSEDGVLEQDIGCHPKDKLGYLYCQYFEIIAPYGRVPLMDKSTCFFLLHSISETTGCRNYAYVEFIFPMSLWVNEDIFLVFEITELAQRYPRLMSLRSVDLSPASWMAVAWYPIYHIPTGRNIRDLSTCFLTFHTLSSSFQDLESGSEDAEKRKQTQGEGISLSPFGLATYKMQGGVWVSHNGERDQERLASLLSVADSWLRQLKVHHHDFDYFAGYRRG